MPNSAKWLLGLVALAGVVAAVYILAAKASGNPAPGRQTTSTRAAYDGQSGIVFIEGKYIDSPYTVAIEGNTVRINSHVVHRAFVRGPLLLDGEKDPGVPDWVKPDTKLIALAADANGRPLGLALQKWAYLCRTQSPEEANKRIIAYMESLPCVATVKVLPGGDQDYGLWVEMTGKQGDNFGIVFRPLDKYRSMVDPSKQATTVSAQEQAKMQESLESNRDFIEQMLSQRWTLFIDRERIRLYWDEERTAERLALALSTMRSGAAKEEKVAALKHLGMDPAAERFASGFQASGQLDRRLEEAVRRTKLAPLTRVDQVVTPEEVERRALSRPASKP